MFYSRLIGEFVVAALVMKLATSFVWGVGVIGVALFVWFVWVLSRLVARWSEPHQDEPGRDEWTGPAPTP